MRLHDRRAFRPSTGPGSRSSLTGHLAHLPFRSEPALTGTLDAVQPIEEPHTSRHSQVKDDFAERNLPLLNHSSTFPNNTFWFRRLWYGRRWTVPGARLVEFSGRFHGETSLVTLEGDE